MFLIALLGFLLFTVLFIVFSSAIIYHLKQYTLPGQRTPQIVFTLFLFLSAFFWLVALLSLLKIPR